ncbi:MarR family winged helix-turn-helix transcriptional regulator [Sphingomonas sp. GB1N7]|uniref:MarR family winged helix-turn-helix transcriptional regulator n=1 Tax=Parasphingomonas caseinilytica TaxID=3096158 RepID=UPI002FC84B50
MTTIALEPNLATLIRTAAAATHQALSRALMPHGVTAAEWALLRDLHAAGAVPQGQIAARLGMTAGAISKLVDRLVAKRLLVRGRGGGGDRRVQIIGLTGTGALLVPELARAAGASEAALFDGLSTRERAALGAALTKLAARPPAG